jgi:hypothetical protein
MDCRQETEEGTRNGRGKRRRHTDGLQTRKKSVDNKQRECGINTEKNNTGLFCRQAKQTITKNKQRGKGKKKGMKKEKKWLHIVKRLKIIWQKQIKDRR